MFFSATYPDRGLLLVFRLFDVPPASSRGGDSPFEQPSIDLERRGTSSNSPLAQDFRRTTGSLKKTLICKSKRNEL
jgi:hypothetical protein